MAGEVREQASALKLDARATEATCPAIWEKYYIVHPADLENVLRQIQANHANIFHRRFHSGCLQTHNGTPRPAGASTPSEPDGTALFTCFNLENDRAGSINATLTKVDTLPAKFEAQKYRSIR